MSEYASPDGKVDMRMIQTRQFEHHDVRDFYEQRQIGNLKCFLANLLCKKQKEDKAVITSIELYIL